MAGHLAAGHRNMPDHGISALTRGAGQHGLWRFGVVVQLLARARAHASATEQRLGNDEAAGSRNANKGRVGGKQSAPSPPAPSAACATPAGSSAGRPAHARWPPRRAAAPPGRQPAAHSFRRCHESASGRRRHGRTPAQCPPRRRRHGVHPQAGAHGRLVGQPWPHPLCSKPPTTATRTTGLAVAFGAGGCAPAHVAQASASRPMPLRQALSMTRRHLGIGPARRLRLGGAPVDHAQRKGSIHAQYSSRTAAGAAQSASACHSRSARLRAPLRRW